MKNMKKIIIGVLGNLVVCTLFISANTASPWISYQGKEPENIKEFKIKR